MPLLVAAFEHFVGAPGGDHLGVGPMFADQQIGGSSDVAIGDQKGECAGVAECRGAGLSINAPEILGTRSGHQFVLGLIRIPAWGATF